MTFFHIRPDAIDRAAGLVSGDQVFDLRDLRREFVEGCGACQASVLSPEDDLGLNPEWRAAIARRAAALSGNPALVAEYPAPTCEALRMLAEGREPDEPKLRAVARHADMIVLAPADARPEHLQNLAAAGLSVPQIIALSELLAFISFQIQVAHGLSLLKGVE